MVMPVDVCEKLVRYSRSCIIGNEPQALAVFLAAVTGFSRDVRYYSSVLLGGELGSGKTHTLRAILGDEQIKGMSFEFRGLFPKKSVWHFTSSSDKAPIYAGELRDLNNPIKLVVMAEYKKLPQPVVEYLKSMSGDDPTFKYMVTNQNKTDVDYILQKKRWFAVSSAQKDMDSELESRIIVMSVDENKWVTQCVIELNHGAKKVYYPITGRTYIKGIDEEVAEEIRTEVGLLALDPIEVINPYSEALKKFEDNSRASSKRVSKMNEALFRASAMVNHDNRHIRDGCIVMSQQDIVNILSFSEIIQSLILGIDRIDLAIIRYLGTLRHKVRAEEIIGRIDDSGLAELRRDELIDRLNKLENNNYILKKEPNKEDQEKVTKWTYNPRKYIHRCQVDWNVLATVDGLHEVVDPITGIHFTDILEFGKWFDKENSKGLEFQQVNSLQEEESFENKVRTAATRMLNSSTIYPNAGKLLMDIRTNMKLVSLDSWGQDSDVNKVVDQMIAEGAIVMDDKSGRLVLLDESIRRSGGATGKSRRTG